MTHSLGKCSVIELDLQFSGILINQIIRPQVVCFYLQSVNKAQPWTWTPPSVSTPLCDTLRHSLHFSWPASISFGLSCLNESQNKAKFCEPLPKYMSHMTDNRRGYQQTHTHTYTRRHRLPQREVYIYIYPCMWLSAVSWTPLGKQLIKATFKLILYIVYAIYAYIYLHWGLSTRCETCCAVHTL